MALAPEVPSPIEGPLQPAAGRAGMEADPLPALQSKKERVRIGAG
jgi:hypothetical protein